MDRDAPAGKARMADAARRLEDTLYSHRRNSAISTRKSSASASKLILLGWKRRAATRPLIHEVKANAWTWVRTAFHSECGDLRGRMMHA